MTDGAFLPPNEKLTDPNKVPGRPYVGNTVTRSETHAYVPSNDPVRVAGRIDPARLKNK